MSASNCPETPRQKMIQMMYLVYTAMLALNVSAEVLAGFITVGDAMEKSNISLQDKLKESYDEFEKANQNNPTKTAANWAKAQEVRAISHELERYIDSVNCAFLCFLQEKVDIKDHDAQGNAIPVVIPLRNPDGTFLIDSARAAIQRHGLVVIGKPDNNNDGTRFFLGDKPEKVDSTSDVPAIQIKNRIIEYKRRIREILGDDADKVKIALNVEQRTWSEHNKQWANWEIMNFDNTIAIADMVVLSRLKSEVMTTEFDAVKELYASISEKDFKFDKITYVTKPVGGMAYVMQGGKYETEVRIAAYDSKTPFTVTANGATRSSNADGAVIIAGSTGSVGEHTITGTIYVKGNGEQPQSYKFEEKYFVAAPAAIVELTNMNVVYQGMDNPVSISVPGVSKPRIQVTVKEGNATFTPTGNAGEFNVTAKMNATGKSQVVFDVAAYIDGSMRTVATNRVFRVKPMPTPLLTFGGKNGGSVTLAEINSYGLRTQYDENFTFKLPKEKLPKIKSWSIEVGKSMEISGTGQVMNNPEVKDRLAKARSGEKIFITAQVDCNDGKSPRPVSISCRLKK